VKDLGAQAKIRHESKFWRVVLRISAEIQFIKWVFKIVIIAPITIQKGWFLPRRRI
jgi:hypothetical protein